MGRAIASWMVKHGAKNLVFASPSGLSKEKARDTVNVLRNQGANVYVFGCDVSDMNQLKEVVAAVQSMPPVRGIIQMAMVIRVGLIYFLHSFLPIPTSRDTDKF